MTSTSAITTSSTASTTPSSTTSANTNKESQYGNACSSNSECTINYSICLGGVCTCEAGYRHETATGMCVETCSEYGTTFIEYVGFGLYTADLTSDGALSITISECMDLCTTTTDVLCLGFNYAYSRCKLKSGSPLTHSSSYDANSAFSYFSRNCL
ncbi:uncharacterized protein LOC132733503 [Ruditapes philippinarum]|uniref:uncharacterized protein LOC132733503 n=1 Tax=Ruditapes philippinarum TaxID=129788 RepID=UPI00295ACEC8|nr:uncharacterized protein LOC132733503 [Ruditapes philippinarum]